MSVDEDLKLWEMSDEELFRANRSRSDGLSSDEAGEKLKRNGANEIPRKRRSILKKIAPQIFDFVIILLLVIASILAFLAVIFPDNDSTSFETSVAIIGVIILSWVLIFIQMYSAERSLEALRKISAAKATVRRDGKWLEIETSSIVTGDIILLGEGDRVPADIRLIETDHLAVDESSLTGESNSVVKDTEILEGKDQPIHEISNMVFMSTVITRGSGTGLIVSTGLNTELGRIARSIEDAPEPAIPLQKKMSQLARTLSIIMFILISLLTLIQITRLWMNDDLIFESILEEIVNAVILSVVAVPWSFPIITTSVMARGMIYLVKENAIVRRIASIEGLGRVSVICSDKTGTMTMNAMTVKKFFSEGYLYSVEGTGYGNEGRIRFRDKEINEDQQHSLRKVFESCRLNNNSRVEDDQGTWRVIGDPTEGALITLSRKGQFDLDDTNYKKLKEISFDSSRKMMSTIVEKDGKVEVFSKGAFEIISQRCSKTIWKGELKKIDEDLLGRYSRVNDSLNADSMRTLALAYRVIDNENKSIEELEDDQIEDELTLIGIVGMMDPPKKGVREAVRKCSKAGIKVVMITGDSKGTASAIAKDLCVLKEGDLVMEGKDLPVPPDTLDKVTVFCRASPDQKVNIVEAFRSQGHIIAMTGDGMNDAAAMKNADVGVAMGLSGVDVAREASQLILSDDNFATIITAIHRGRQIFDNIRKSITYQMFTNLGELSLMFLGTLIFIDQMMTDKHLLFLYFSTHLFPVAALVLDKTTPGIMKQPPRSSKEGIISKKVISNLVMMILSLAAIGLSIFYILENEVLDLGIVENKTLTIQTMILNFVVWAECFNLFNSLSMKDSLGTQIRSRNMTLPILMALIPVTALTLIMYLSPFSVVLDLVKLTPLQYLYSVVSGAMIIPMMELLKYSFKRINGN